MNDESYAYEWLSTYDAVKKEYEIRVSRDINKLCTYGIRPLDESLVCIVPNELIVIGADSAVGKTELALQIARHNLQRGKKIAFYHLEGGWLEAIARMKFRDVCEIFYSGKQDGEYIELDYRRWMLNLIKDEKIKDIAGTVDLKYKEYKDNLMFYSSENGITLETFIVSLLDFHKLVPKSESIRTILDLDLIIIDHLQYFSLTKAENDIGEITAILRQVKNITDNYGVPVVLISHLRKKGKDRGMPDQEDFYGSSNIPKIASTAITIAPATTDENLADGIFPTYFRVVKSRIGIRPNYVMLINFFQNTKSYDDKYKIYKLTSEGHLIPDCLSHSEIPSWAKSCIFDDVKGKTDDQQSQEEIKQNNW